MRCKKYRKYLRLYWRNAPNTAHIGENICGKKKQKYTHRKYLRNYLRGKKQKKPMAPYLGEGVKKENFFLGLCPKLWVGGGQKS